MASKAKVKNGERGFRMTLYFSTTGGLGTIKSYQIKNNAGSVFTPEQAEEYINAFRDVLLGQIASARSKIVSSTSTAKE